MPWLNPYTAGPTPNTWPWLFSALCAVALWLFKRRLDAGLIIAGWAAVAALSAVIGLVQYFGAAEALAPWISQARVGEAFGNLRQRNQFATLISIGLVALIGLLALRPDRRRLLENRPQFSLAPSMPRTPSPIRPICPVPLWGYGLAGLLALGNAASNSRTGLLQWLLVFGLFAAWSRPDWRRLPLFALQSLMAYGVAVVLLPVLLELATGIRSDGLFGRLAQPPTCESRKILWSNVLTLIGQKPWLGWGWGELDYAHFITLYPGPRFCDILDNAHNLPLHLAVELGIPAALVVCGALGWLAWRARPWRETDPLRQTAWGVLAVIGLHSLVEYPLWYGPFQIAAGLCVWLLCQRAGADRELKDNFYQKSRSNRLLAPYLRTLIAILIVAILAWAAVSYHRVSQIYLPPAQRSAAYRDDTMNKIRGGWLFHRQALFAELSITPLTPGSADAVHAMATELLHYSPEPRVIEKLIESAVMLGRDEEALQYLARYRAAFPKEHARWADAHAPPS